VKREIRLNAIVLCGISRLESGIKLISEMFLMFLLNHSRWRFVAPAQNKIINS